MMEILKANFYNTTTMVSASTGTGTFANLFDNSRTLAYSTVGHSSDTSTNLTVTFGSPTVISAILMLNHNLRDYRIFYNSATANSLANVSGNSATSTYLSFASVTVSTVTLQLSAPQSANTEKRVGEWVISEGRLSFTVNPPADGYKPQVARTKILHKMPDGGITMFQVKDKFHVKIEFDFISTAFHNSLRSVFDDADPFWFIPMPTTTGWDAVAHEVLWTNDFDFTWGDNSQSQGYNGKIELMETPGA